MSLSDSDDDIQPGSSADSLLRRMGRRVPTGGAAALNSRGRQEAMAMDPASLEAQLLGAGVTSPFNTWPLEEALRQQLSTAVDRRHHEIEAFERALHGALSELHRVRAAEEVRLAARVAEATARFGHQMEALQQQYLSEVEKLKRQAVTELNRQRAISEAAIAARTRALQAELRYDRPAGLKAAMSTAGATAGRDGREAAPLRPRDSSPGPGPNSGFGAGTRAAAAGAGIQKPAATITRMRSAPSARAGGPMGAGAAAGAGPDRPSAAALSPAAAATPVSVPRPALNRSKLESGEGLW